MKLQNYIIILMSMKERSKIENFLKRENELSTRTYNNSKKKLNDIIKYIIKWNIKKIYLFGSILHKNEFHYNSDIDIAVEGVSFKKFSELWFKLGLKFPLKIDLINLNDCDEYFKTAIEKRGKLVYEK